MREPIISQMGQVGYLPALMGPGQLSTNDLIEMTGDYSEGLRANALYFKDDPRPVSTNFTNGYREMWNEVPHDHAALAYDALMIAVEGIERAGVLDRAAIRDENCEKPMAYDGVTGGATFDENGDSVKQFIKIEVIDGLWQVEETLIGLQPDSLVLRLSGLYPETDYSPTDPPVREFAAPPECGRGGSRSSFHSSRSRG